MSWEKLRFAFATRKSLEEFRSSRSLFQVQYRA